MKADNLQNHGWLNLLTPFILPLVAIASFGEAVQALTFNFSPRQGTPQQAIDSFVAAGQLWSGILADDVTVNIEIGFEDMEPEFFGEASPTQQSFLYREVRQALIADSTSEADAIATRYLPEGPSVDLLINYTSDSPHAPNLAKPYLDNNGSANNTYLNVPTANAKALGLVTADRPDLDGVLIFNSFLSWDFNRSNGINPDAYDFISLAAHGIGNILGFTSGVDVLDYNSPRTLPGDFEIFYPEDTFAFVTPMDLFRFSQESVAIGSGVIDWTASSTDKYFSFDGGNTQVASFSTGVFHGDGRQARNWKDGDLDLGIMAPFSQPGQQLQFSNNDRLLFDVIGWNLKTSGTTATVVPETTPTPSLLMLSWIGIGYWLTQKRKLG